MNDYASLGRTDADLADSQREALLVAFDAGYFGEPRTVTLSAVPAELEISQPAASGLTRRASRRIIPSSMIEADVVPD